MVGLWFGKWKDERCVLRACAVRSAGFGSGGGCTGKKNRLVYGFTIVSLLVSCVWVSRCIRCLCSLDFVSLCYLSSLLGRFSVHSRELYRRTTSAS